MDGAEKAVAAGVNAGNKIKESLKDKGVQKKIVTYGLFAIAIGIIVWIVRRIIKHHTASA